MHEIKNIFHLFNGLSVTENCLKCESAPLANCFYQTRNFSSHYEKYMCERFSSNTNILLLKYL